jgi:hypothetical protein
MHKKILAKHLQGRGETKAQSWLGDTPIMQPKPMDWSRVSAVEMMKSGLSLNMF